MCLGEAVILMYTCSALSELSRTPIITIIIIVTTTITIVITITIIMISIIIIIIIIMPIMPEHVSYNHVASPAGPV